MSERTAKVERVTRETEIRLELHLDGTGAADLRLEPGFLGHMLELFTVHGGFNLYVEARGDHHVDDHHLTEDLGICLGQAVSRALGDRAGVARYGHAYVPMDEALARVCLDLSNRPYLHYQAPGLDGKIGAFDAELVEEFLRAFSVHGGVTLHVDLLHGRNRHHMAEAVFKALGRALAKAVARRTGAGPAVLSSKGSL